MAGYWETLPHSAYERVGTPAVGETGLEGYGGLSAASWCEVRAPETVLDLVHLQHCCLPSPCQTPPSPAPPEQGVMREEGWWAEQGQERGVQWGELLWRQALHVFLPGDLQAQHHYPQLTAGETEAQRG